MKEQNTIEFGISSVKLSGAKITVEGRCHRGPIRLGDTFSMLSEMIVQTTPESCGPTSLHPLINLKVTVDAIWAYGHQIEEITQTMTARLELSGTGTEYLKVGLVLSSP